MVSAVKDDRAGEADREAWGRPPQEVVFEQGPNRRVGWGSAAHLYAAKCFRQREQQMQRSWGRTVFVFKEKQGGQYS